jgi:hypothetical protein
MVDSWASTPRLDPQYAVRRLAELTGVELAVEGPCRGGEVGAAYAWRPPWIEPRGFQERMDRVCGLITLTAAPSMLPDYAAYIYTLGDYNYRGVAYAEVDWPNGEIQVFRDYQRRTARTAARAASNAAAGACSTRTILNRIRTRSGTAFTLAAPNAVMPHGRSTICMTADPTRSPAVPSHTVTALLIRTG